MGTFLRPHIEKPLTTSQIVLMASVFAQSKSRCFPMRCIATDVRIGFRVFVYIQAPRRGHIALEIVVVAERKRSARCSSLVSWRALFAWRSWVPIFKQFRVVLVLYLTSYFLCGVRYLHWKLASLIKSSCDLRAHVTNSCMLDSTRLKLRSYLVPWLRERI